MSASRLPALGIALLAAACVTVTPVVRSTAPTNSCTTSEQCQSFAPGRASPACVNGICESSSFGNWTAIVSLSQDAAYAAGVTFAVPFSTLLNTQGTCVAGGATCPPGMRCAPLPALVSPNSGELQVEPAAAFPSQANWNLGNPMMNTLMPVEATFRPQLPSGSSLVDATTTGLPLAPVDAQEVVDTSLSAPRGPGGGPGLFFSFSLAPLPTPLLFERTLMPVAPFDQAFPPDISVVDMSAAPGGIVTYGCDPKQQPNLNCAPFDTIPGSMGFVYPTFVLSRADRLPLDGWTAYLQDQTTLRRISNAVMLSGTMATGVKLLTSRHRASGQALENAALVMQPPSSSSLPTAILTVVNGALDSAEVYPQLPMPVPVSGTVTHGTGGAPVAADVVFDAVGICRNLTNGTTTTVVLDTSDFAFSTTVSAADGSYSAVLPMGVYRATVRPYDTTAQVTAITTFATTVVMNGQCGAGVQPGPIVVEVQRTVRGVASVGDGRALADASIDAIPTACSDNTTAPTCLPRAGGTRTANDGSFLMSLDPGSYLLRVRPAEGSALPWVVTPLVVGPSDLTADTPLVPAPTDAGFVLQDPVACNPIVEAVVRMYEIPATGSAFEVGEALTDSTGHYDMYLAPPAQ